MAMLTEPTAAVVGYASARGQWVSLAAQGCLMQIIVAMQWNAILLQSEVFEGPL